MRTWGGRFATGPDQRAADFSRSTDEDRELILDDLRGSIAHARALGRAGILAPAEVDALVGGLDGLGVDFENGQLELDASAEDVHMSIEASLEARVGPVARKLHTGRSRNDQVSTDLRLWLRRTVAGLDDRILGLERALVVLARRHGSAVMPGHTHAQPAQPVLFAHHLLAHVEMLERDRGRLADALGRANLSPLGSGALAGAGFPLDREAAAAELGFDGVTRNSIDASGDRDFAVETLAGLALLMVHLSRLAEEVVWWSHPRFGFVRPADDFATGSSMLPNKRNPDPAELVRARATAVIGALSGCLALLKGLPLGYQRDLQEVKPPLFAAARSAGGSLEVMAGLVETLEVDAAAMGQAASEGYTTATAVAEALVEEGVAFRSAHRIVGQLVREAEAAGSGLADLGDDAYRRALAESDDERAAALATDAQVAPRIRRAADVDGALARCDVIGGTAPARVAVELERAEARLGMGGESPG